jgi:hypothetical protein
MGSSKTPAHRAFQSREHRLKGFSSQVQHYGDWIAGYPGRKEMPKDIMAAGAGSVWTPSSNRRPMRPIDCLLVLFERRLVSR